MVCAELAHELTRFSFADVRVGFDDSPTIIMPREYLSRGKKAGPNPVFRPCSANVPVTPQGAVSTGKIDVLGKLLQTIFPILLRDRSGLITKDPLFPAYVGDSGFAPCDCGPVLRLLDIGRCDCVGRLRFAFAAFTPPNSRAPCAALSLKPPALC